jgi:glycerophosphoryl diester phosphodiesterase
MIKNSKIPLIIAHRGASKIAPENTLKAFQKAIELKADFIEFDLQQSKDKELVITHDEDLSRLTGYRRRLESLTLKELKKLDFGEGEKIPTFRELINLVKEKIGLNCEIKVPEIAERTINLIRINNIVDSTIISSFLHEELLKIKKIEPKIKIAALVPISGVKKLDWMTKQKMIDFCIENGFYAINPLVMMVDQQFVNYAHDHNVKVFPWTVDIKITIKKLLKYEVDGIITNDIVLLQKWINDFNIYKI